MKSIHKYKLTIGDELVVEMPEGARLLDVQVQRGEPCLWALVDTSAPPKKRHLAIRGTGHAADGLESVVYVGTFQLQGGGLIFHLFDRDAG